MNKETKNLFDKIVRKASLKQAVYQSTYDRFLAFKNTALQLSQEYEVYKDRNETSIPVEYVDKGDFEFHLKFGGDILMFLMHTNVFEFSRNHEIMKTQYIKEDISRSYCGIINIYNFLADSFKYNRINDLGYMIGRIFINKDQHYFLEGKREIGLLFNNFGGQELNQEKVSEIINSSIEYTLNFDLLVPPYDNVKFATVHDMATTLMNMKISTGKRLGFRFQGDHSDFQ
jgi:hypothetical protein